MKKILAVASLLMVLAGLWMAILGYVEPSSSFRVMVVVGLLVAVVLSVVSESAPKWVIRNGKSVGGGSTKEDAEQSLSGMQDINCFAISTRALDIVRVEKDT